MVKMFIVWISYNLCISLFNILHVALLLVIENHLIFSGDTSISLIAKDISFLIVSIGSWVYTLRYFLQSLIKFNSCSKLYYLIGKKNSSTSNFYCKKCILIRLAFSIISQYLRIHWYVYFHRHLNFYQPLLYINTQV